MKRRTHAVSLIVTSVIFSVSVGFADVAQAGTFLHGLSVSGAGTSALATLALGISLVVRMAVGE